jgi:D-alanine-D-alanine ligase
MTKKIKVALIYGGESVEHEVSCQSAKNILQAIDKKKYDVTCVEITKNGSWFPRSYQDLLENTSRIDSRSTTKKLINPSPREVSDLFTYRLGEKIDVVFPILHGTFGEDGSVQGLLKMLHVPFVGSDVLGSAVCMNKDITKRLLRDAGIPIGDFISFRQSSQKKITFEKLEKRFGLPFFVKPANLGSSVGVYKIQTEKDLLIAVKEIFSLDTMVIFEKYIEGREIEVAVLGNENPEASIPGEIKVNEHSFYSYEAKYVDENGALLEIPAHLTAPLKKRFEDLAIQTYKTLDCSGMARVDFFLQGKKIFVNEVNTLPGFTAISMYPKLWKASGVSYQELISKLINLAIKKYEKDKKIYSYSKLD